MRLSEYVGQVLAGARQGWAADEARAGDPLVQAFVRVEKQRAEVESLRPASVYDEGAKSKLDVLSKKIENNARVLARLDDACSQLGVFNLGSLKQRTMELREEARRLEINHEMDLEPFLTAERTLGLNTKMYLQNPRVIKMTEERDAKRAAIQKEVASINEKIDCLEAILRDFKW
jgi:hypothetical protein